MRIEYQKVSDRSETYAFEYGAYAAIHELTMVNTWEQPIVAMEFYLNG